MTAVDGTTKVCSRCNQEKPVIEFYVSPRGLYGVRGDCKECSNKNSCACRDKEKDKAAKEEYRKKDSYKEYIKNYSKEYYEKNKEKLREVYKERHAKNYVKKEPKKKNCARCKNEFLPVIHHKRYCSDDCRKASQKEIAVELSKTEGLTKACFTCGTEKPLTEYNKQHTGRYGVENNCRECKKKKYRDQVYGGNQTTKCLCCGSEFESQYRQKYCSDKCKWTARRQRDRLSGNSRTRKPRTPNQRKKDAAYARERRKNNPEVAIRLRINTQIRKAATKDGVAILIRKALNRKGESRKVEEMLGYTITDLRFHLEKQFTKKMTWELFTKGEIHIDHILPKASFDLSDDGEWKACWALPNLRPLWAYDNLAKNDKIVTLL
jgi:hypothetical protein